jgi:hypothetical protein
MQLGSSYFCLSRGSRARDVEPACVVEVRTIYTEIIREQTGQVIVYGVSSLCILKIERGYLKKTL